MSKRKVQGLLRRIILETDTESRRTAAELLVHEFTIDKDDIYREIIDQVRGIYVKTLSKISINISPVEELAVEEAVETYYKSLTNYFKGSALNNPKFNINYTSFGSTKLVVTVSPIGTQNVFKYIRDSRELFLPTLRKTIMQLLQTGFTQIDNTLEQRIEGNYTDSTKTQRARGGLQLGHDVGSSIAEIRGNDYVMKIQGWSNKATPSRTAQLDPILKLDAIVNSNSNLAALKSVIISATIQVREHGQSSNGSQGASYERAILRDIRKGIEKVLAEEDWANFKSSPSPVDMVIGEIHKQAKKSKFTKYDTKAIASTGKSSTKAKESSKPRTKKTVGVSANDIYSKPIKVGIKKSPPKRREATSQNWLSFVNIINAKLADRVKGNMTSPKLVNRTGRFAESAKVTTVETTTEGFPSFVFDYQRNPYEVFDRVNGRSPWNTPNRDPKSLVALSIREIAQELAIGRFYTRRA